MANQWYYGQDDKRLGPFSGVQLKQLAALGTLSAAHTVWKEGVEQGALATRIKNLFAVPAVTDPVIQAKVEVSPPSTPAVEARPGGPAVAPPDQPVPVQKYVRKMRAIVVRGAVISSQDGETVRFRKKCLKCGFEDESRSTMRIRSGVTNDHFFCPKCRKSGSVAIQGVS